MDLNVEFPDSPKNADKVSETRGSPEWLAAWNTQRAWCVENEARIIQRMNELEGRR